jgi:hypothetical protein
MSLRIAGSSGMPNRALLAASKSRRAEAAKVSDEPELRAVADTYESKYGARLTAREGTWFGMGDAIRNGEVVVYRVAPSTAWGFGKGKVFSEARWAFSQMNEAK